METIMDIRVQLSSCVPATHLETSGADLPIENCCRSVIIRRLSALPNS